MLLCSLPTNEKIASPCVPIFRFPNTQYGPLRLASDSPQPLAECLEAPSLQTSKLCPWMYTHTFNRTEGSKINQCCSRKTYSFIWHVLVYLECIQETCELLVYSTCEDNVQEIIWWGTSLNTEFCIWCHFYEYCWWWFLWLASRRIFRVYSLFEFKAFSVRNNSRMKLNR